MSAAVPTTLNSGDKHFLRLIARDVGTDGWTPVSSALFPLVEKMPKALVELERTEAGGRGRVRLTDEGASVLRAMEWLS